MELSLLFLTVAWRSENINLVIFRRKMTYRRVSASAMGHSISIPAGIFPVSVTPEHPTPKAWNHWQPP